MAAFPVPKCHSKPLEHQACVGLKQIVSCTPNCSNKASHSSATFSRTNPGSPSEGGQWIVAVFCHLPITVRPGACRIQVRILGQDPPLDEVIMRFIRHVHHMTVISHFPILTALHQNFLNVSSLCSCDTWRESKSSQGSGQTEPRVEYVSTIRIELSCVQILRV